MKKSIKIIVSAIIVTAICFATVPMAFAAGYRGDVNGDEKVNASDALVILRNAVGFEDDNCDLYRADVNGDGNINATDAFRVLMMSVGSDDPTTYAKTEILRYYADAFESSCDITPYIYYSTTCESRMVNDANKEDYVDFGWEDSAEAHFEDGWSEEYGDVYEFCPLPWIDADLVKSAKITKIEEFDAYKVEIVFVEDFSDDEVVVPYDTYPYIYNWADCTGCELEGFYVEDATSYYPGSKIIAEVTEDGYLTDLTIEIPFVMNKHLESYDGKYYSNVTESGTITDIYSFMLNP